MEHSHSNRQLVNLRRHKRYSFRPIYEDYRIQQKLVLIALLKNNMEGSVAQASHIILGAAIIMAPQVKKLVLSSVLGRFDKKISQKTTEEEPLGLR